MDEQEFNDTLIAGIEAGRWVALLEAGEMRIYHIEHTDDDMLKRALPVDDVRRLLVNGEAD